MDNKSWLRIQSYAVGNARSAWKRRCVVAIGVVIFALSVHVGEKDDAPGAVVFGFLIMIALLIFSSFLEKRKT